MSEKESSQGSKDFCKGVSCKVEQDGSAIKLILSCDDSKKAEAIKQVIVCCQSQSTETEEAKG